MSLRSRRLPLRALAPLLGLALLVTGCGDDPTCVFTSGCQGGSGPGALGPAASLPSSGQVILAGLPTIQRVEPSGLNVCSTAPIVVTFSESMAPSAIAGQIQLTGVDITGFPFPVPTTQTLVADGRVLLIFPQAPLVPSDYVIDVAADGELFDLTGQRVEVAAGSQIGSFQVDVNDPVDPSVVTTFPAAGDQVGTTTPLVVVFDRRIESTTVTDLSFDVSVDGAPPGLDPLPTPLTVQTGFLPIIDTRVYVYQSVDGVGTPVSLGTSADIVLTLSPDGGDTIEDEDGGVLAEFVVELTTQDLEVPLDTAILSTPMDGIGIANLTAGDPEELAVQVDLLTAEPGDEVLLTLFGDSLGDEPQTIALGRVLELEGTAPITSAVLSLADIDLASSDGVARFADGTVAFAFALRRGGQTTALRLLDVDLSGEGIQDPLLDTTAPTIDELLNPGGGVTAQFRSDVRDLVVSGTASESLRSVEVSTALGDDNGLLPPVVGTDADGRFIAAPVLLGQVEDGVPLDFTLIGYDPVLNASEPITGTFEQRGGVGGTSVPFVAGDPIAVEVFDAVTLAPIDGARVYTHDDEGDGINYPSRDAQVTDATGLVSVNSSPAPAVGTILTVDAPGYDLFSFHGVSAGRVSVPLSPTGFSVATVAGVVTTSSDLAALTLGLLQGKLDDSRRLFDAFDTFDGQDCESDPFGAAPPACPFGPEVILPGRLGALAYFAGNFLLSEGTFSASTLIQAFELSIPRAPTAGGSLDEAGLVVPFLLSEPNLDISELPVEIDATTLSTALTSGIDTNDLVSDPETTGEPWVSVEALVPGVAGTTSVGLGLAFDQGGGTWSVRAAYPGAVSSVGFFGASGAVDTDLFLRAELRDSLGNRTGQRPRLSKLDELPLPFNLFVPAVPTVSSPTPGSTTAGPSFNVEFANAIVDISAQAGIYAVSLTDEAGRSWRLYLPDPIDGQTTQVHLPDIAGVVGLPGDPLAAGALLCRVEAYAWPDFDVGEFLWTDLAREHDLFAVSAPITFSQP